MFINHNGSTRKSLSSNKSLNFSSKTVSNRSSNYDDPYSGIASSNEKLSEGINVSARNSRSGEDNAKVVTPSNSSNIGLKNGLQSRYSLTSEEPALNIVSPPPTNRHTNNMKNKLKPTNKEPPSNQFGKPPRTPSSLSSNVLLSKSNSHTSLRINTSSLLVKDTLPKKPPSSPNGLSNSNSRTALRMATSHSPLVKKTLPRYIQNDRALKAKNAKEKATKLKPSSIPILLPRHMNPHIDKSQQSWVFNKNNNSAPDSISGMKKSHKTSSNESTKVTSEQDLLSSNRYLDPANKHAYISSITDENQVPFALVLSSLVVQTRTYAALVIIIGDDFTTKSKTCLEKVYDRVITVKKEECDPLSSVTEFCWEAFVKIHAWALIEFTKCVYIDVDCLVLKNIDELFQCEEISAVPSNTWSDFFSTGVFVLKPSDITFQSLVNYVRQFIHQEETEEAIINSYFYNWSKFDSKKLSQLYNVDANCNPIIIKRSKNNIRVFRCSEAWSYWMQEEEKPIIENAGTIIVSLPAYSYQSYLLKWFVALFENEHVYNWISSSADCEITQCEINDELI